MFEAWHTFRKLELQREIEEIFIQNIGNVRFLP